MGAIFDATGQYRYALWREWASHLPRVAFIMLNPSTADATRNDRTIHRCIGFAQSWGYGALEVVNLFAYRTPSPKTLRAIPHPIGQETDRYLLEALQRCDRLVLAWGNGGTWQGRDRAVLALIRPCQPPYCLGTTQEQQPRHPLYLPHNTPLMPFTHSAQLH